LFAAILSWHFIERPALASIKNIVRVLKAYLQPKAQQS
jgi:peptidoglycan/LPS O-acetylase OafA/YrhL